MRVQSAAGFSSALIPAASRSPAKHVRVLSTTNVDGATQHQVLLIKPPPPPNARRAFGVAVQERHLVQDLISLKAVRNALVMYPRGMYCSST